jgi:enterochelin esterase-like enzyme
MALLTPPSDGAPQRESDRKPHREAYVTSQGRDLRLDIIRGTCVAVMIVDHIAGKSPLYLATGGNRFLTSAAEGFILISGLTAGLVYRRLIARDGLEASVRKAIRRALSLYLLAIGLGLLIAPLSELFNLQWAQGLDFSRPVDFVVSVLTLHRTYYLADVMVLYALLFALMPVALVLLHRGHARALLGASALLWLLFQFFPEAATVTWPIEGNYLFMFSAWQILFFATLVLGYERHRQPVLAERGRRRLHLGAGLGLVFLGCVFVLINLPANQLPPQLLGVSGDWDTLRLWIETNFFGKANLGPGRVLAGAVMFTFLHLSLTRWWPALRRPLAPLMLPLGQNALYAFAAHAFLAVAVPLALVLLAAPQDNPWLNASLQVAAVAIIWAGSRWQLLAPAPRTRAVWQASPLALAAVAIVVLPLLPFDPVPPPLIPISDAVLARARSYGTPVASLEAAMLARGAAGGLNTETPRVVMVTSTRGPATPTSTATPMVRATQGGARAPLAATPTTPRSTPVMALPTTASAGTPTIEVTPTPEDVLLDSWSVPPLPADERLLQSEYVGPLAGKAYALSHYSDALRRELAYWVYLPPGYGESATRYPVLYMLHGGGGGLEEWAVYGLIDSADLAFREGILRPFIIVLPEGEKSFWTNWANDSPRWGDYLAYEVVWQIDSSFATLRSRSARAVGGNSMGGWGALYQGFTHPDIFGVVVANSPSLYADDGSLSFLGTGEEYASKDPIALSLRGTQELGLQIWLDVGEDDPWLPRVMELQDTLQERGVKHEWRLYPGVHGPEYWVQHVPDYLGFCGSALRWH